MQENIPTYLKMYMSSTIICCSKLIKLNRKINYKPKPGLTQICHSINDTKRNYQHFYCNSNFVLNYINMVSVTYILLLNNANYILKKNHVSLSIPIYSFYN